jgi:hypothetical protein
MGVCCSTSTRTTTDDTAISQVLPSQEQLETAAESHERSSPGPEGDTGASTGASPGNGHRGGDHHCLARIPPNHDEKGIEGNKLTHRP